MTETNWNALDKVYETTADTNGFDDKPVPDGAYAVRTSKPSFQVSKQGHTYLFWVLKVTEGPHKGRTIIRRNMLVNKSNMTHFKRDVAVCGVVPPENLSIFSDADNRERFLKSLEGVELMCRKKTKGEFEDVYFDAMMSSPESRAAIQPTPEPQPAPTSGATGIVNPFADDEIPY